MEADKAKRIRGWLATNARLERLEDFDGFMVFADAGIATSIVVFDTTQPHGEHEVEVRRLPSGHYATSLVVEGVRNDTTPFEAFGPKVRLSERPWHFHNPYATALFARIDGRGDPLTQVCELGQGMQTGANGVFGKLSAADVVDHDLPPELLKPRPELRYRPLLYRRQRRVPALPGGRSELPLAAQAGPTVPPSASQ